MAVSNVQKETYLFIPPSQFEALSACLPQRVEVFIDGLDEKPAIVFIECSDDDAEMTVE